MRHLSEETKRKISEAIKGKRKSPFTEEHKRKLSEVLKGRYGGEKHPMWGKKHSVASKKKMSESRKGKHYPKVSEAARGKIGEKSNHWKGGITSLQSRIRKSFKYQQWRQDVFIRDGFTCQKCGDKTGGNLEAHHKMPFTQLVLKAQEYLPLLSWYEACLFYTPLWDIDNGITLCQRCHHQHHKRGKK